MLSPVLFCILAAKGPVDQGPPWDMVQQMFRGWGGLGTLSQDQGKRNMLSPLLKVKNFEIVD